MKGPGLMAAVVVGASLILAAIAFALVGEVLRGAGGTATDAAVARLERQSQNQEARIGALEAEVAGLKRDQEALAERQAAGAEAAEVSPPAPEIAALPVDQFGGDAAAPANEGLGDPMQLAKRRFNQNVARPTPELLRQLLGEPRQSYSDQCQPVTNPRLIAALDTRQVGNFKVTMLKPALNSFQQVMDRLQKEEPEIYAALGTAGALCVRHVRGAPNTVSSHAWGAAVDLTLTGNLDAMGDDATQFGLVVLAEFFNDAGWYWGAGYGREEFDALRGRRGAAPPVGRRRPHVMAGPDGPRTVVRPPGPPREDVFAGLAGPMLALAAEAARAPDPDAAALAAEARRRAEAFETAALRAGVPREAVGEARDALLAVLEARALGNPALPPARWAQARRRALPGVPEPDAALLARRRGAAEAAGPARRDLARFLRHCEEAVAAAPAPRTAGGVRWGLVAPLLFVAALVAWAGWAEWRFATRLLAAMPETAAVVEAGQASPTAAVNELDAMAAAAAAVEAGAARSPLGLAGRLGRYGPGATARVRYTAAVDALLPGPLGQVLAETLASEGGSLALYDTLRSLAILEGAAPWQPGFVAGWLADRAGSDPALGGLARHAGALSGPPAGMPAQDAELLAQARAIAAEGDPAAFAFLELARDPRIQALPGWSPTQVPDLATVLVRRSGRPIGLAIPGLFTAAGWEAASGGAARDAIGRAATEGARVVGKAPAAVEEPALLEELQRRTLDAWAEELADLRVKPFTDQPGSVLISGTLGRSGSPLEALFRAVWHEVGGDDRRRSHPDQQRIATWFGPMIQFVEQGHMAEIAQLFAGLNVALSALDADAEVGRRRLMDVQARAASIAALNQAPRLLVQIVEDVLAQTAASQQGLLKPRAALVWQTDLAGACRFALADRYPFAPGPDADLGTVAAMIGTDGVLARFTSGALAPLIDRSDSPWRWKPEARLSGFGPESVAFFERATAVGQALFPPEQVGLTLTALAQRGAATVSLGGASARVETSDAPAALAWPGPDPAAGLAIAFLTGGEVERRDWAGPWGLLKFLDGLRLRARDGGQRYLLDVRLERTRAYLELAFASPANPAAAQGLIRGLMCPPAL